MEITQYIKLKDSTNSFEQSYKSVNGILFLFSILGNTASIIFAFFYLYKILSGVTDNFFGKALMVGIITIVALTAFELLKRFLFRQTAITLLKQKSKFERYSIGLLSLLIVSTSFYLSLSGAHTLSDKSKTITVDANQKINLAVKQIETDYAVKTNKLDKQIDFYNSMIANGTKSRVLRSQYNNMIIATNASIEKLNLQKDKAIATAKNELNTGAQQLTEYSNSNVRAFLLISTFIELIILIGVGFDTYYNHRIFADFDALAQNNRKVKYYVLYNRLLDAVYNNGKLSKNDYILSACILSRIIKSIDIQVTTKQVNDFYKLLNQLQITENKTASKRIAAVSLIEAKQALKSYYKI